MPVHLVKQCRKIEIEFLVQRRIRAFAHLGEVELEHQIPVAIRRRMRPDPKIAEELFEIRLLVPVVVERFGFFHALGTGPTKSFAPPPRPAAQTRRDRRHEATERIEGGRLGSAGIVSPITLTFPMGNRHDV